MAFIVSCVLHNSGHDFRVPFSVKKCSSSSRKSSSERKFLSTQRKTWAPAILRSRGVQVFAGDVEVGGFGGSASPEADLARHLKHFFTFVSVRIVLRQLQELGSWETFNSLQEFATSHSLKDGDQFMRELMKHDQSLALRVLKTREIYACEEFEWDNVKKIVIKDVTDANLDLMRERLFHTTMLSGADFSQFKNDP
mmetsp:Transcript_29500/g.49617  ORF Transcript_29500/g.49617 Transcript_29500/m.49617 type:complete len:196 (-) Transcript_29500:399-986(-)|eukprot:CAMPEP_0184653120 /NCGR_PEP_ID=MMETSP0308-20130426/10857_1 /TAXON_ID=38269 /ORGANISM="Gloeochaete witrockiana, Strain SAG 46.84" /LENGTH=195 /DNA_ID=CAMNT_0027088423 /DNA_START=107 /DNA_END=694 /DNA_ORIENTATION=-